MSFIFWGIEGVLIQTSPITAREYDVIIQPILFQTLEVLSDCTLRMALPATAWAGRIIGCHYSVKCEHLGASVFKFHSATPKPQCFVFHFVCPPSLFPDTVYFTQTQALLAL